MVQVKYFVMEENQSDVYPVETSNDLAHCLRMCKQWNIEEAGNGLRYFVIRDSDGQTWEFINGQIYRIIRYPLSGQISYEGVAI